MLIADRDNNRLLEVSPTGQILWRFPEPGDLAAGQSFLLPDDAMLTPGGAILAADIKNCRLIVIRPPVHHLTQQLGQTGNCTYELGVSYGSPNGAFPMSDGDMLANDDRNDRVIVIDPHTNRIVWQYGHTHQPGPQPGYLSNPDGVDLAPPYSLTMHFAHTLRAP